MRKVKLLYLICTIISISILFTGNVLSSPIGIMQVKWSGNWRPYGGYADELLFVVFSEGERAQKMLALQSGEIDADDERVLSDYIAALVRDPNIDVTFSPGLRYRVITLNCEKFPTNITGYRRAIAFGYDKYRANMEAIGGIGLELDSYVPWSATEWEVESQIGGEFYAPDYAAGNASLEKAGFRDLDGDGWREYDKNDNNMWDAGIDIDDDDPLLAIEMGATSGYDPAIIAVTIAVEGLAVMGMRATVVEKDFGLLLDELILGQASCACWTEGIPTINTIKQIYDRFHRNGADWAYYHFVNQTIEEQLDLMVSSTTKEDVKMYGLEASKMLLFEQPQIVVYNDAIVEARRNDVWEGFFEFKGAGFVNGDNKWAGVKVRQQTGDLGGTFRYACSDNLNTLNVMMRQTGYEDLVFQYVYEGLYNVEPENWDIIPGLAYDWNIEATIADAPAGIQDGEKYTFYLYENETWHDGNAFTAEDVKFTYEQVWHEGLQYNIEADSVYRIDLPNGADGHIVEMYINQTGYFMFPEIAGCFAIVPEHIWSTAGNISSFVPTNAQMVGTGPYKWNQRVPGEYISLLRHQNWRWDIRDASIETPTETSEPQKITVTVPASCPECPSPATVVVTDEITKTVVKTIYPEDTSETTESSEEPKETPSITPGFEFYSVFTMSVIIGVLTIYRKRRRR
ncbi:MAG: hypothetical protein JSW11_05650 [Candidatus Heimdallarchaeota archaeon]|nr:MAG: hypothetical protein JSW11_05650 [Candidatus Heimdallarchaeota archaeon]